MVSSVGGLVGFGLLCSGLAARLHHQRRRMSRSLCTNNFCVCVCVTDCVCIIYTTRCLYPQRRRRRHHYRPAVSPQNQIRFLSMSCQERVGWGEEVPRLTLPHSNSIAANCCYLAKQPAHTYTERKTCSQSDFEIAAQ